jgi:acetyltransferase-like isoleucine patch superfamily enzyme
MTEALVIYGAGAQARKVCHAWMLAGGRVEAFVDDNPLAASPVPGVELRKPGSLEGAPAGAALFVAIGRADVRRRLVELYAGRGWRLPAVVHPRASIAPDARLGDGVFVGAGAVVESAAQVGRGAIVDIGALVDHDARIAAFVHLRAGTVCGAGSEWNE